jgi:hypothetical protein
MSALALSPLQAADATKPNTLTLKEIADGWLLLFDGETTFGWHVDGDVKAKDGVLILGGAKPAKVMVPFNQFEMRLEFRNLAGLGGTNLVLDRRPKGGQTFTTIFTGSGESTFWSTLKLTIERNPALKLDDEMKFKSEIGPDKPGFYENSTTYRGDQPTAIRLDMTGGNQLAVRNVKLRPLGLKPIFNGKDLTGWKKFEADPKRAKSNFTVTPEGWLNIKTGPGDLQTEGQWGDFVLQLDCISNGKHLNSGVFFRCRPAEYQQGYEAQIHNGFTAELAKEYTIEEYDPQTHELKDKKKIKATAIDYGTGAIYRRIPARRQVSKDHEWFTMTVVANGRHLATWVNGFQVVDWTDNRPLNDNARNGCRLEKGPISLQGHDPTTDLSFRNIRIADLGPAAQKK